MKRRQKGKIAKNKFFSLIGSQRKHIKPDMPLIFNWEFFWENTNVFWKLKFPLSSSRRKGNIYKVAKQLFSSTIRCLLFCNLTDMFSLNLQIVFISPHHSLLTFFLKNNPKNREFTIYLLDPPTYELGTFSAKISHHAKNKYYGSSIQITACLNLRHN